MPDIDDSPYRPFVLWFETLPSGDTAQVYLLPHPDSCGIVAQWNGQARRSETWNELPNLMGIGPDDLAAVSMPWA